MRSEDQKHALPCDTCPNAVSLTERVVHLDARLDRIDEALFGDGNGRTGIVDHVETLVQITRVGRSTFRVFMWIGGLIAAAITAAYQLKSTLMSGILH